jgi:UDP-N-acetylmuramoyl-L-alanyl-D-glutamate--2,6-diaminopimelate ligase
VTYRSIGSSQSSDVWASDVASTPSSTHAVLHYKEEEAPLSLSIPGTFNLLNAMAAVGAAVSVGIPFRAAVSSLDSFKGAPGRMERIDEGQSFTVLIDFTVTPAAYEATLTSAVAMKKSGSRLLVLTGSCGDRMKEKRPTVGKLCSEYADVVIVSNEDPYGEDPGAIIDDVFAGIRQDVPILDASHLSNPPHTCFAAKIPDRLHAIQFLLRHAKPDDIVLFCGKGGDTMMWTAHGQVSWDEDAIVRKELRAMRS